MTFPRPRTIRAKLTLTTMLVFATLLAIIAALAEPGVRQALLGSIDQDLRSRAQDMMQMGRRGRARGPGFEGGPGRGRGVGPGRDVFAGPRPPRGDFPLPEPNESSLVRPRIVPVGGATDRRPMRDAPYDPAAFERAKSGVPVYSTPTIGDEPVRVYSQPIREEGQVRAVIQVAYPLGETMRSLERLRRLMFTVFFPIGIVLAGAASLFLVGRLLSPLRMITRNADSIGATNLTDRLPVVGEDEFASLASTLNGMLGRLESGFRVEQETARKLAETVEQQRRFTADASHELKTPLAVIKANTGLMLHVSGTPEETRESVQAIDDAASRMNRLVKDLLVLARAEAGQIALRFEPVDLRDVVRSAVAGVPGAEAVEVRVPETSVVVDGSREDLLRVVVNLVNNALKHSGAPGTVVVALDLANGMARISVSDRGRGIGPNHLPHLFDRFYRTDESRTASTGGTGLGLAICRGIVEAHGGTIEARSGLGAGSRFDICLPTDPSQ